MSAPSPEEPLSLPSMAVIVGVWTIPALLASANYLVASREAGHAVSIWVALAIEAPAWYVWALLTPIIGYLGTRFRFERGKRSLAIGVHVAASLVATACFAAVGSGALALLRPQSTGWLLLAGRWFWATLPITTVTYAGVLALCLGVANTARLRSEARRADQLAMQLSEAELAALRMQLQPHFLFNALNSIMALVRDGEVHRSVEALADLGDMLRTSLRSDRGFEVTLSEELEFVRRYLAIERLRFADRLRVEEDVPASLGDARVPAFVLQPLVENALHHGVLPVRGGGTITISARTLDRQLHLHVGSSGAGLAPDWEDRVARGVGLANTRARLARLHGPAARLIVRDRLTEPGVDVEVELPLRRAEAAGRPWAAP